MTEIAVRKELLVWARKHRGLSVDEAAEKLSVTPEEVLALESGAAKLNLTMFRRYSERFRVPLATLLRQTAPPPPVKPRDFRTTDGRPAKLGFEALLAVSYAETVEHQILELVDAHAAPAAPVLPRLSLGEDAAVAGERERQRLGVSVARQFGWSTDEAFRMWRTLIEGVGAYVLQRKFALDDCKGFTLFRDPNAPIIMLNKSETYEPAKIFTLVHEYAHLLLRQPGISDLNDANPVEAFCNRFAAGFLIPRGALMELLQNWPDEPVEWARGKVTDWARKLKVSQQALALRLEELGLAPAGFYGRLIAQQQHVLRTDAEGGNYVLTQVSEVGYRFTNAVLDAEDAAKISTVEASDMLAIAPRHFGVIKDRLEQQFATAGVGVGGVHR